MKIKVTALKAFHDLETGKDRKVGESFELSSVPRLRKLISMGLVRLEEIRHDKSSNLPSVVFYQKLLYVIGGIETWSANIAKLFKGRNITFVFTKADLTQLLEIAKYCDVVMDNGTREYKCDIFISANYDGGAIILDRVKAKRKYQTIHSDFNALKHIVRGWSNFNLKLDNRFDKILAVSETAQKGLLDAFRIKSDILPNPLAEAEKSSPVTFITLSRASEEKGILRIVEMARRFEEEGRDFIWLVCSTLSNTPAKIREAIESVPELVIVQPQLNSRKLISKADYLVQLSDTEAYCYSIREALQQKVPVIATKFDEAKKIIKNGKNGYLVDFDLSDLDSKKIFEKIPKIAQPYKEELSDKWLKLLDGRL